MKSNIKLLVFALLCCGKITAQNKVKIQIKDKDTLFTFNNYVKVTGPKKSTLSITKVDSLLNFHFETPKYFCDLSCNATLFEANYTKVNVDFKTSRKRCIIIVANDKDIGGGSMTLVKKKKK